VIRMCVFQHDALGGPAGGPREQPPGE
jgi:hypothetical protein